MIKKDFLDHLKKLQPEDWVKQATSKWTVKDIVAHMIGWEKHDPQIIQETWQTKELPWWRSEENYDEFNKKEVEFYKEWKPEALIKELELWQNKVTQEIESVGEGNLRGNIELFGWLFDESETSHYAHHLKQIKQALARKIWFKRKTYGWGWTPSTWQGWTILGIWIVLFIAGGIVFENSIEKYHPQTTTTLFLLYIAILVFILIRISYKYGESPKWQWGEKKDSSRK